MASIENLKNDKELLEQCMNGIVAEIQVLQKSKTPDHSLITKKMRDKSDAQILLNEKTKELEIAELNEKSKPSDADQLVRQAEIDRINKNYLFINSSYPK